MHILDFTHAQLTWAGQGQAVKAALRRPCGLPDISGLHSVYLNDHPPVNVPWI